jgi:hypothetical protein
MRRGTLIAILLLVALLAVAAVLQILRWTDGDGRGDEAPTPSPAASP